MFVLPNSPERVDTCSHDEAGIVRATVYILSLAFAAFSSTHRESVLLASPPARLMRHRRRSVANRGHSTFRANTQMHRHFGKIWLPYIGLLFGLMASLPAAAWAQEQYQFQLPTQIGDDSIKTDGDAAVCAAAGDAIPGATISAA
jgi:hypothetical protein